MKDAYEIFRQLIEETQYVDLLYSYVQSKGIPVDVSDLLRWQLVQIVSALDKLVHDLVRIGMLEEFQGVREKTDKYKTFPLGLNNYEDIMASPVCAITVVEQKIVLANGHKAFQDPDKIADALSYIWNEPHKWKALSIEMGMDENDCKKTLRNIVIRRNQIVHEGDYPYLISSGKQVIIEEDVKDIKSYILKLGEVIYYSVRR